MSTSIKVQRIGTSRINKVDFSNLPFGAHFSDHVFIAEFKKGVWENLRIEPFGNLSLSPSAMALHYGQAIFEGMKATKDRKGNPFFFRPEEHAKRLNRSAARMCMPALPEEIFLDALQALIYLDRDWIPGIQGSSLYIRPFMFATDPYLGVRPANEYTFMILTCPVGPYYAQPVSLLAETDFVRAVKGGTGEAKAAGNYAASLLPAKLAQEKGFDQVMWLDGVHFEEIQEVGTMNLMFVINGKVITPKTDGAILKGITRDTFLQILKAKHIPFEERVVTISEIMHAGENGSLKEVFGVGTAAVLVPIKELTYKNQTIHIQSPNEHAIGSLLKKEIEGLRAGDIADQFGWLIPVIGIDAEEPVSAPSLSL
jgi:branched-chain amino acid aminotransferase